MGIEEGIDMESRIIEAAKLMFVTKGYEATKMGDIAAEVGVSRTSMHYYFRTKEMLFEAIFSQLMQGLLPNLGSVMDEKTTMLEKLPKIMDLYMSILVANPLIPIFVINEFQRDPEHLYKAVLKEPSRIEPIIRLQQQMTDEMEQGVMNKMPLIYTVTTVLGLLVFPLLARNPLTTVFMDGDEDRFKSFMIERKPFVKEIVLRMLTPDKNVQNK